MHFQPWRKEVLKLIDKIDVTGTIMLNRVLPEYAIPLTAGQVINQRGCLDLPPPPDHDYSAPAWIALGNATKAVQLNEHQMEYNRWLFTLKVIENENSRITKKRKIIKKQRADAIELIYSRLDDTIKNKIERANMITPFALMEHLNLLNAEFSARHVGLLDNALDEIVYEPRIGGVEEVRRLVQLYADKMQDNGEALTVGMIKRKFYQIFATKEVEDLKIFHLPPIIAVRKDPNGTLQQMVSLMLEDESEYIDKISKKRNRNDVVKDQGSIHYVKEKKAKVEEKRGEGSKKRLSKKEWNPSSSEYKKFFEDRICYICNKKGHGKRHCPERKGKGQVNTASHDNTDIEKAEKETIVRTEKANKRKRTTHGATMTTNQVRKNRKSTKPSDFEYQENSESSDSSDQ
jgi:hypothetical protein